MCIILGKKLLDILNNLPTAKRACHCLFVRIFFFLKQVEDEENIPEKYVEYDSDENEIEVILKKDDVRKNASNFVENEAELSESDWGGSDDENENGIDNYEKELGDADVFDESKIHSELERIRL